jgi:hypothetical protein
MKEFGQRLAKILLAWQKAGAESGLVAPVKNISRSCCRDRRAARPAISTSCGFPQSECG